MTLCENLYINTQVNNFIFVKKLFADWNSVTKSICTSSYLWLESLLLTGRWFRVVKKSLLVFLLEECFPTCSWWLRMWNFFTFLPLVQTLTWNWASKNYSLHGICSRGYWDIDVRVHLTLGHLFVSKSDN